MNEYMKVALLLNLVLPLLRTPHSLVLPSPSHVRVHTHTQHPSLFLAGGVRQMAQETERRHRAVGCPGHESFVNMGAAPTNS